MQKAIVAGGAGFIGSHLCESLLKKNFHVICIDNLITGSKNNIASLLQNPSFTFVEKDIVDKENVFSIKEADFIFHLASPASPNKYSERSYIKHPLETMLVNSQGTYNLLELARKLSASFLFASTSEVYGNPTVSPQPETYFGNVNPNGIRSVYDEAKRFGEALTMLYVRNLGINARIIRIFNTYGPYMQKDDGRVVSNFINQALQKKPLTIYGKGNQTRSFCYVDDMVNGIEKAMFQDNTTSEVFNLGSTDEKTIHELALMIKNLIKSDSEIQYESLPQDDPLQRKPDITKAKTFLNWQPFVTLEEGLKKTIEYFSTQ